MNKFKTLALLAFSVFAVFSHSCIETFEIYSKEEHRLADTAANIDYLSADEKEVFYYMNLVRLDGERFFNAFIEEYFHLRTEMNFSELTLENSYVISLKERLAKVKNLGMIIPDKLLTNAASFHARESAECGSTSHESKNGDSFPERIAKLTGNKYYYIAENLSFGWDNPLGIVCQLLVDEGVESLGHRENILNINCKFAGVAIDNHTIYNYMCVIDFSSDIIQENP